MPIHLARYALAGAALIAIAAAPAAADMSKEECVDVHSRGQDARDAGKISLARKLFLTCAQSACPAIVQSDCARFADDLDRQQPSMSFAARDGSGADLPDTTVYVDDALIVTRLDDGKAHDADPGKHVVRFTHGGREQTVTVVLNSGEKGRTVLATFPDVGAAAPATPAAEPPRRHRAATRHPTGAKILLIAGGAAVISGAALAVVGLGRVPDNCSVSSHECLGPPGDPSIADAERALQLTDLGLGLGGLGGALVVGGLVWYVTGAHTEAAPGTVAMPFVTAHGGGVAISGPLW